MSNDLVGHQLGSYKVTELVRHSGMVEVYAGYHVEIERDVSIKVIGRRLESDPLLNERFRREWKALVQLRHPNIVQVYDFGEEGGGHYVVQELVEGTSLADMLQDVLSGQRFVDQDDVSFLTRQIASGLDFAHSQGALHYDLSPSNVLIRPSGQAVITDFGLAVLKARSIGGDAGSSSAPGTPDYMAPEQAIDTGRVTYKSDIYSLGIILYQMTTGTLPFAADTPVELALKHLNETPPAPRQLNPTLPRAVSQVILTALAKDPADRFERALALSDALAQAWSIDDADDVMVLTQGALQREGEDQPIPVAGHDAEEAVTDETYEEEWPPGDDAYEYETPPRGISRRISPLILAVAAILLVAVAGIFGARALGVDTFGFLRGVVGGRTAVEEPLIVSTPSPETPDSPTPTEVTEDTPTPAVTIVPDEAPITTPEPLDVPPLEAGSQVLRLDDAMAMVYVPDGAFLMGTDDLSQPSRERPLHEVNVSGFWLDQTEVTNVQYRQCVDAGACPLPIVTRNYADPRYRFFPVAFVTWDAATAYCTHIGNATGLPVRLPTEAQWEKAASWDPVNESKRTYPWGEELPTPDLLRYDQSVTIFQGAEVGTHPAGASAYGAFDMAGNMWEYVFDWFDFNEDYYTLPEAAFDPQGPPEGTGRMVRGGSWARPGSFATTTRRSPVELGTNGEDIGFRCATNATSITPQNNIAFDAREALGSAQAAVGLALSEGAGSDVTLNDWQAALITMDAQLEAGSDEEALREIDARLQSLGPLLETGNLTEETAFKLRNALTWIQRELSTEGIPDAPETG